MTNPLCFSLLDKYVNCYKIYSYQFVTSGPFEHQFDPSTDSYAFEVEVHEFIICLRGPTVEQITTSGNKVTSVLKVIENTKSLVNYARVLFTHYV